MSAKIFRQIFDSSVAENPPYLAINWQQPETEARITCRDRRFPTPPQQRNNAEIDGLVTTSHVFSLVLQGKAVGLLPISRPISDFFGGNCTKTGSPGPNRLFRR
jgi:hypothetical protein